MAKQRLDALLVERGLAETRSKAQALIMAGEVRVDGVRCDKPGTAIKSEQEIDLKYDGPRWVSRGAHKLLHGLAHFGIDTTGMTAIDVGASTGGFTEVLLKAGAERVFAVDVGHGQLAWSLRQDPRVVVLEKTNARYLTTAEITQPVDIVVCDASFISLEKVLPAALSLTAPEAWCCALIKPQFQAGRGEVGKGGVVRDQAIHERVCAAMEAWFDSQPGWRVAGITSSPIRGPSGNIEFLIGARKSRDVFTGY